MRRGFKNKKLKEELHRGKQKQLDRKKSPWILLKKKRAVKIEKERK